MAKGKTKENKEIVKRTGFFEGEVVAINPTKAELSKLLGSELEGEEIVYTSTEEAEGKSIRKSQIVFWIRSIDDSKYIKPVHFFLKDLDRQNTLTEEEEKSGSKVRKHQYINNIGTTSWADKPENLPEWFTERPYRKAKVGEEEVYNFVMAWLNKLDRRDPEAVLLGDFNKFINGEVKELRSEIGGDYAGTVCPLVVIRTVEKDGEKKEYEQIYSRNMMPGFGIKQVRTKSITADFIAAAKTTDRKKRSLLQRFVLEVTDPTYGIKEDHYVLGELQEYDPTKNPRVSGKVLTEDDTDY